MKQLLVEVPESSKSNPWHITSRLFPRWTTHAKSATETHNQGWILFLEISPNTYQRHLRISPTNSRPYQVWLEFHEQNLSSYHQPRSFMRNPQSRPQKTLAFRKAKYWMTHSSACSRLWPSATSIYSRNPTKIRATSTGLCQNEATSRSASRLSLNQTRNFSRRFGTLWPSRSNQSFLINLLNWLRNFMIQVIDFYSALNLNPFNVTFIDYKPD